MRRNPVLSQSSQYDSLFSVCQSQAEAQKAYRKAALKTHPDTGGSKEQFQALQDAYERAKYRLQNPEYVPPVASAPDFSGPQTTREAFRRQYPNTTAEQAAREAFVRAAQQVNEDLMRNIFATWRFGYTWTSSNAAYHSNFEFESSPPPQAKTVEGFNVFPYERWSRFHSEREFKEFKYLVTPSMLALIASIAFCKGATIMFQPHGNELRVCEGNWPDYKDRLKDMGFQWNPHDKYWTKTIS